MTKGEIRQVIESLKINCREDIDDYSVYDYLIAHETDEWRKQQLHKLKFKAYKEREKLKKQDGIGVF